jgi:murein DD-endopeptidase MepM/ murein hydrolase activator NlpD
MAIVFIAIVSLVLSGCLQQNAVFPTSTATAPERGKLLWPIDCKPGEDCTVIFPDIDNDGRNPCGSVGYAGHTGTDLVIGNEVMSGWQRMDQGVAVRAAADGEVLWVFDGKYDRCVNFGVLLPDESNPDCKTPDVKPGPNVSSGYLVCTDAGRYCKRDNPDGICFWCFAGGNVVIIKHENMGKIFATRYDHLKNGSILVKPGDHVTAGQKIAEVGSAGRTGGPHLHFEVWRDFYEPIDPWPEDCGLDGLWQYS